MLVEKWNIRKVCRCDGKEETIRHVSRYLAGIKLGLMLLILSLKKQGMKSILDNMYQILSALFRDAD